MSHVLWEIFGTVTDELHDEWRKSPKHKLFILISSLNDVFFMRRIARL
jgi:hypothetical protein